ncbi:DUF4838 domain-containing protein [Devosia nitrariae]|uniref:DUF4838 domain-containing protein n=1 Tax=Devosia nitrariae TaxID=2071872 RepID=A0ABQ5W0S3_9HYPH|nr:DUF4838 domain-containing protein [Devosia nitrariae]GLQ53657.1 hypothetical protein GCM10010862_09160 [Devosia nitrariae]
MKSLPRIVAFYLALAMGCTLSNVAAADGIVNGGFEAELSPWWQQGQAIRVQQVEGRQAVLVPSGMVVQEHIPVTGGHNYRITMDIRSEATRSGTVYVQMSFRGSGVSEEWRGPSLVAVDKRSTSECGQPPGATREEKAVLVTGGGAPEWRTHSLVFTAPNGASEMVLYLRKGNCSPGVAAYTNVSISPSDEPATSAADLARVALAAERLPALAATAENAARLERQLGLSAPSDDVHHLAEGGTMRMRVHVGSGEDIITLQAAADLSDFAARVAGAEPAAHLSTDEAVAEEPLLVIGRDNALAARAFSSEDFGSLGEDGFLIRSLGPHILIAGANPRGTMYGVNWFLDRRLGVRWLAPDVTYWPATTDIALPAQDERQVPRFAFREVLSIEGEDKAWRQRNLLNGESHGPSYRPTPPEIDSWNASWAAKDLIANFYQLLPPNTYRAEHPEWYQGGQLAMMDNAMRAEMARAVIERLRALPDYRSVWFAIHDMDWGWDMDPDSRAFADRHGGHASAPRLDMMIDVADQVRAVLPDARLAFNAYHWSFTPPEGMTVPDYILVYPMTIHVDYSQGLNEPANAELGRDLAGWNAIAEHVLVWDHITNFGGFIQPTPNLLPIGRSIQWLDELDAVDGYMGEGSFNTAGAEFAALRAWMISRLLWDPQRDPQALIEDFSRHYYGSAAGPIVEYIALMHERLDGSGDVLAEKTTVEMAMFDADFIVLADALFDEAEALADDPTILARVREARVPVDYVMLMRRHEYLTDATLGQRLAATLDDRVQRFWQTIDAAGIRQYMQGHDLDSLRRLLAIERHPSGIPGFVAEGIQWKDIQDLRFNRYSGPNSDIVADPMASDGAAIALDRSSAGWNAQLKFDSLPREGRWWVYLAVRTSAVMEGGAVARIGSAPPMGCYVTVTSSDIPDTGYTWVEVPGGPFAYSTDHALSLYAQPMSGPSGQAVLLDRAAAVDRPVPGARIGQSSGGCP